MNYPDEIQANLDRADAALQAAKVRRFFLQLDTDTPKEARQFMDAITATETSYEEWEDRHGTEYTCSFGYTHYRPQQINRLADTMGIAVIYVAADEPNLITP